MPRSTDVPEGPAIIVANEFFDALPINQAVKRGGWHERLVEIDVNGNLAFTIAPRSDAAIRAAAAAGRCAMRRDGAIFEWRADDAGHGLVGRRVAKTAAPRW